MCPRRLKIHDIVKVLANIFTTIVMHDALFSHGLSQSPVV